MSQPGEEWLYNTESDVPGVLIERAADQPIESFLRKCIFEPLGLRDTGFSVVDGKRDRLTTAYAADPATGALDILDSPEETATRPPRRHSLGRPAGCSRPWTTIGLRADDHRWRCGRRRARLPGSLGAPHDDRSPQPGAAGSFDGVPRVRCGMGIRPHGAGGGPAERGGPSPDRLGRGAPARHGEPTSTGT